MCEGECVPVRNAKSFHIDTQSVDSVISKTVIWQSFHFLFPSLSFFMAEPEITKPDTGELMRKIHERPQMPLAEWLRAPSHVHYKAFRMSDPPVQRSASREEFRSLLEAFKVPSEAMAIRDDFGYGVKVDPTGDRMIMIWEAHTEYYS